MHYFSLNGAISTLSLELYQKCKFRHRAVYASARLHSLCKCFFHSFGKPEDLRTKKKKKMVTITYNKWWMMDWDSNLFLLAFLIITPLPYSDVIDYHLITEKRELSSSLMPQCQVYSQCLINKCLFICMDFLFLDFSF